jgi:hypothetical protein
MTARIWLLALAGCLLILVASFGAPPPLRHFEITGHIGGLGPHHATVYLTAPHRPSHSATTRDDGSFIIRNVVPGSYTLRPRNPRFRFSPPAHGVGVSNHDVHGVRFEAHELPPHRR